MTENPNLPARRPRRNELELAHHRQILAGIALRNPGATSVDLSQLFEAETGELLNPRTIRDDITAIKKHWLAEMVTDYNELKSEELAKLDILEQEAWNAWNQSKGDFIKQVIERARRPQAREPDRGEIIAKIVGELAKQNTYLNEEVVETIVHDAIRDAVDESVDVGEDSDMFVSRIIDTTEGRIGDVTFLREIHRIQQERRKVLGVYAPELHQVSVQKVEIKGYVGWSPDQWKNRNKIVEGEIIDG